MQINNFQAVLLASILSAVYGGTRNPCQSIGGTTLISCIGGTNYIQSDVVIEEPLPELDGKLFALSDEGSYEDTRSIFNADGEPILGGQIWKGKETDSMLRNFRDPFPSEFSQYARNEEVVDDLREFSISAPVAPMRCCTTASTSSCPTATQTSADRIATSTVAATVVAVSKDDTYSSVFDDYNDNEEIIDEDIVTTSTTKTSNGAISMDRASHMLAGLLIAIAFAAAV